MKRLLLAFTAIAAFFTACDTDPLQDAVDNFALVIGLEPINTTAVVAIYDAETGELVEQSVTVSFGGPAGDQVIDIFSDKIEETEIDGGILAFGISNDVEPSAIAPTDIYITISAAGYLETTRQIQMVEIGSDEFDIELIPLSALPENITVEETTLPTDENGNPIPPDIGPSGKVVNGGPTLKSASSLNTGTFTGAKNGRNDRSYKQKIQTSSGVSTLDSYIYGQSSTILSMATSSVGATPVVTVPSTGSIQFIRPILQYEIDPKVGSGNTFLGTFNESGEEWGLVNLEINFRSNSEVFSLLKDQSSLVLVQSKTADYNYLNNKVVPLPNGVQTFNGSYTRPAIPSFGDLKTDEANLFHTPNPWGDHLALLMSGEHFKYQTIGVVAPIETFEVNLNRNGFNGAFKVEVNALGFNFTQSIPAGQSTISISLPRSPIVANAKLPWTTFETLTDLSSISGNVINIELPQKPSEIADANITIQLTCPTSTESVRLNSLPGVPLLYRKTNAPQGTRWSKILSNGITWDYDSSTKTLNGGSFTAGVEIGSTYVFKMTVDNKIYDATVTIDSQDFTYQEEVDEDYCD